MKNVVKLDNKTDKDQELIANIEKYTQNRRSFLQGTAGLGVGFFGSMMLGACGGGSEISVAATPEDPAPSAPTDETVLNFALNLEYLEAEFYLLAATGMNLPANMTTGKGAFGAVTGGSRVPFVTPIIEQYANEIAADERDHVAFLRTALGASAVARPSIDFVNSFTGAALAAGLIKPGQTFNPFLDENSFLLAAYIFEDVGVTAYKGAAPLLASKVYLEAAAGLMAAEAYHAGLVRTVLYSLGMTTPALIDATEAISKARDSLDGAKDIDQGIAMKNVTLNGASYKASNIVPLDANGLAYSRSPGQVLNIAYLNPDAVGSGGFFPNGVNGDVKQSASSK